MHAASQEPRKGGDGSYIVGMTTNDPLGLLDRAISQTGAIVARVRPEQASLPTPCSDFDVRQLLNHLVYDAQTFTTMVTGAERGSPDADLIGDDWVSAYQAATTGLMDAWRVRGADGTMKLGLLGEMPAVWAVGQHYADITQHGWDVARATGQSTDLDAELGQASLDWARQSLKPEYRGKAFAPEVSAPEAAPVYDKLAAFFGRRID
jgi:uncharacterized protein (TIGR03086 family)